MLTAEQLEMLDLHVQTHLYLTAKEVAHWVEETFGVTYTESGMTALLHRLGFVYKKPLLVPGKADAEASARLTGVEILFVDEAAFRSDNHAGTTWSPIHRKDTSAARAPRARPVSAAIAVTIPNALDSRSSAMP